MAEARKQACDELKMDTFESSDEWVDNFQENEPMDTQLARELQHPFFSISQRVREKFVNNVKVELKKDIHSMPTSQCSKIIMNKF